MKQKYFFYQVFFGLIFCFPIIGFGQSFTEQISNCYKFLVENQDLTVIIETTARDANAYDRIVDQENFLYVNDASGYYMNMMGMEVIQTKKMAIKIDHELMEISILPVNPNAGDLNTTLPTWLLGLDELGKKFTIDLKEEKEGEKYLIKKEDLKLMEILIQKNKVKKVIQYPQEEVEYEGEQITAILEMEYTYQKAQSHLKINEVLDTSTADLKLRKKYKKYQLFDYRKKKEE